MIQSQSYLKIIDNTGVKEIMCIKVLGNNKFYGKVGDIIIGVVKEVLPNMPIKKSSIIRAVIVRTKKIIKRKNGTSICFDDNAAVIINAENNPRGTRILGPIALEIKEKNFSKLVSLANEII